MRLRLLVLMVCAAGCQQSQPPQSQPPRAETAAAPASPQTPAKPARVTVLVPPPSSTQKQAESSAAVEDTHYTFTQPADAGMTLSLTGSVATTARSESAVPATTQAPAGTVRGVPVYVSENEGIKTATWMENGTAYALDLECASASDKRCASSEYILERVRTLVSVPQPKQ